jgi:hypothetical protein
MEDCVAVIATAPDTSIVTIGCWKSAVHPPEPDVGHEPVTIKLKELIFTSDAVTGTKEAPTHDVSGHISRKIAQEAPLAQVVELPQMALDPLIVPRQ